MKFMTRTSTKLTLVLNKRQIFKFICVIIKYVISFLKYFFDEFLLFKVNNDEYSEKKFRVF